MSTQITAHNYTGCIHNSKTGNKVNVFQLKNKQTVIYSGILLRNRYENLLLHTETWMNLKISC